MKELNVPEKIKNMIQDFLNRLKALYGEDLISLVLYGSAASGEFVNKYSNLNFLIVLKSTDPEILKKATILVSKFPQFSPLFFTERYIAESTDVFPIEFLDLKENNILLYGKDVLSGIEIDTRNLRFQCEQELKVKLISLRNAYVKINNDGPALRAMLFRSATSILHILRNILRLKGRQPVYKKEDILKEVAKEFQIDITLLGNILAAKNNKVKLNDRDTEVLFGAFLRELEKIVEAVDRL